jgi:actin-related protein
VEIHYFKERIEEELRAIRPFNSPINVIQAKDAIVDSWKGASRWALEEYSLHCIDRYYLYSLFYPI